MSQGKDGKLIDHIIIPRIINIHYALEKDVIVSHQYTQIIFASSALSSL